MPHLTTYIGLADHSEQTLAELFRTVAEGHARAADVFHTANMLAGPTTTATPSLRLSSATARRTSMNRRGSTPPAWPRPGRPRSGYCATCRTSTSSPPSCRQPGR